MYKIRFKKWKLRKYNKTGEIRVFARRSRGFEQPAHSPSNLRRASPPMHIKLPADLELPEQLVHALDIYLRGSFEKHMWHCPSFRDETIIDLSTEGTFSPGCLRAFVALALRVPCTPSETARARMAWSYVSDAITSIIRLEDPHTCIQLCGVLRYLSSLGRFEIGRAILEQCARLGASAKESANHPLRYICIYLLKAPTSAVSNLFSIMVLKLVDTWEIHYGDAHLETLVMRVIAIKGLPEKAQRLYALQRLWLKYRKQPRLAHDARGFLWAQYQTEQEELYDTKLIQSSNENYDAVGVFYSLVLDFTMSYGAGFGPRKVRLLREVSDEVSALDDKVFEELALYSITRVQWMELFALAYDRVELAEPIRKVMNRFANIPSHYVRDKEVQRILCTAGVSNATFYDEESFLRLKAEDKDKV